MNNKLKELLDAFNDKRPNTWIYVGVQSLDKLNIHELHFDKNGDFLSLSEEPVNLISFARDGKAGILDQLKQAEKSIRDNIILTEDQAKLIRQSIAK